VEALRERGGPAQPGGGGLGDDPARSTRRRHRLPSYRIRAPPPLASTFGASRPSEELVDPTLPVRNVERQASDDQMLPALIQTAGRLQGQDPPSIVPLRQARAFSAVLKKRSLSQMRIGAATKIDE
jgi:hypothetical protein